MTALIFGLRVNMVNFGSKFVSADSYNSLGKQVSIVSEKINNYTDSPLFLDMAHLYGMFTGVNRASAFFSPNVGFIDLDISLTSNGEKIAPIYTSIEGGLRMETYYSFLTDILGKQDEKLSKTILQVLGKLAFVKNKSINQVDAKINLYYYPKLEDALSMKNIEKIEVDRESFDLFMLCRG